MRSRHAIAALGSCPVEVLIWRFPLLIVPGCLSGYIDWQSGYLGSPEAEGSSSHCLSNCDSASGGPIVNPNIETFMYQKYHSLRPKMWRFPTARWKTFGEVVFDVFQESEREFENRMSSHGLVAAIPNFLILLVRYCIPTTKKNLTGRD